MHAHDDDGVDGDDDDEDVDHHEEDDIDSIVIIAVLLLCVVGALLRGTFIFLRLDHQAVPLISYNGVVWWLCADLIPM